MLDFEQFYQEFLEQAKTFADNFDQTKKIGSLPLSDAMFCLEDIIRTRIRCNAIQVALEDLTAVEENVHIVDAGCGTGVLGIWGLLNGASQCTFIDTNADSIALTEQMLEHYDIRDQAILLNTDAKTRSMIKPYHLLISETLCSDLVSEDFIDIINNLRRHGRPDAIIIPQQLTMHLGAPDFSTSISIDTSEELPAPIILPYTDMTALTDLVLYDTIECPHDYSPLFMNERKLEA